MNIVNQQTFLGKIFPASRLLNLLQIFAIATIALISTIFYLELTKPKQKYYASNIHGKTSEIIPLNEPNVSTSTLLSWTSLAVTSAYTLDFHNYEATLEELRKYFTKAGYKNFREASDARIQEVIKQKLIVTAVTSGTPVLLGEGSIHDFYSWRIQLPILLSYQGASERSTKQNIAVTLLVTRVPTKDAYTGIGIAQIQDVVTYN